MWALAIAARRQKLRTVRRRSLGFVFRQIDHPKEYSLKERIWTEKLCPPQSGSPGHPPVRLGGLLNLLPANGFRDDRLFGHYGVPPLRERLR